jgi:hypothetical protein
VFQTYPFFINTHHTGCHVDFLEWWHDTSKPDRPRPKAGHELFGANLFPGAASHQVIHPAQIHEAEVPGVGQVRIDVDIRWQNTKGQRCLVGHVAFTSTMPGQHHSDEAEKKVYI